MSDEISALEKSLKRTFSVMGIQAVVITGMCLLMIAVMSSHWSKLNAPSEVLQEIKELRMQVDSNAQDNRQGRESLEERIDEIDKQLDMIEAVLML